MSKYADSQDSQLRIVDPDFQTEEHTRSYYAWRADGYDKVTVYEIEHHCAAIQLADVQQGGRVLEVACGTGRATLELASHQRVQTRTQGWREMVLVNMNQDTPRKTLDERAYEAVRLFPCRPVVTEPYVSDAGFVNVQRICRNSYSRSMLHPFGTEIVTAQKP